MKNPFYPDERRRRITEIEPAALAARGIRGIILDVDNTLTTHDNPRPAPGVLEWLERTRGAGLRLIVLSNNHPERVSPFAGMLGLAFEADGKKPLPGGFLRACAHMGLSPRETAAVGDQIFTDVIRGPSGRCLLPDGRSHRAGAGLVFPPQAPSGTPDSPRL